MFRNFVSLRPACQVASSMSKYGLRSWSGPFDWLVTGRLQWVLRYMENFFCDFLQKDNLEVIDYSKRRFQEKNRGFSFIHDKDEFFCDNYEGLKEKYRRKIERFKKEITKPTCFLRAVVDDNEIRYIKENSEYINSVIKRKM